MPTWTDPGEIVFDAVITTSVDGRGAFVELPGDPVELFGTRCRIPVVARLDEVEYRGSLVAHDSPHALGVLRAVRTRTGKGPGDVVRVVLHLDDVPRVAQLDAETELALRQAGTLEDLRDLPLETQREVAGWIGDAPDTAARLERAREIGAGEPARGLPVR